MLGFRRTGNSDGGGKDHDAPKPPVSTPSAPPQAGVAAGKQGPAKRLGEILIEGGLIGEPQLEEALAAQRERGGFIGQILVEKGFVRQEDIVSSLVKQCKIPHLSLLDYEVSKDVLGLIPREICLSYNLLPIDRLGRILTVAMVNPFDGDALDQVRKLCPELRIKPILCDWDHFRIVSARVFGAQGQPSQEYDASQLALGPARMKSSAEPKPQGKDAPAGADRVQAALNAAVQDVIEHAASAPVSEPPQAKPVRRTSGTSPDLSSVVRESIGGAMQEAMANLMVEARGGKPGDARHPAAAHALSPHDLAEILREGVSSAMQESMAAMTVQLRAALEGERPAAVPASQDLTEMIRQGIGSAMQETLGPMLAHLRVLSESEHATAGATPRELAEVIRQGIGSAMQEALGPMVTQMRGMAAQETVASSASPQEMAEVMRQGIGTAMQEALGPIMAQIRAISNEERPVAPPPELSESLRQTIGGAVQEALASAMTQMQERGGGHGSSPAPSTEELAEVLRAAVREALRESEGVAVARTNRRELEARDADRAKRLRHSSVSTFPGLRQRVQAAAETHEFQAESDEHVLAAMRSDRLLEDLTFDRFLVGRSNTFTHKLCEAVSARPGGDYNPFFLYGDVGVGKTHLINATGNAIVARDGDQRVGYVSASRFASRLAEALREDAGDAFRANYCHWDVLILDDIQFLGGRVEAQEEFFHIFNVLRQEGRQIIIAGDQPPDRLGLLEQRLVSRFSGGIVAHLRAPEWETRVAILQRFAGGAEVKISEDVLSLVAMRVPNDVRKMIGALRKIIAYAALVGEAISCETANEVLSHLGIEEAA